MAKKKPEQSVTRREFVADSAKFAAGAAVLNGFPTIVPRHVLGRGYQPPSATLNFATVGFGGMGSGNSQELCKTENMVAVCDVDMAHAERQANKTGEAGIRLKAQYDKAAKYTDFREMLDKQKDIDAVVVATPDHLHAVIAAAAMKAGKHVYVQKPLTSTVYESRYLKKLALANPKLVTQNGNQGHSSNGTRRIVEWVQAGLIGPIREVHIYTNRPAAFWAQGLPRPALATPNGANSLANGRTGPVNTALANAMASGVPAAPDGLRWDLYLGPVAEDIPYHPIYHPFTWRGWTDFGAGALGDMGAHLVDQAYWALGLTQPTSIEATSTAWGTRSVPPPPGAPANARATQIPVSFPLAETVHYQFPARGNQPPVKMTWYDGGLFPPRHDFLPDDFSFTAEGGGLLIGEKGAIYHRTYGNNPVYFPAAGLAAAEMAIPETVPRVIGSHEFNWVQAIRGEAKISSPFEYAAELTETMLLGVAALRAGQGRKLYYDAAKMEFTNAPDANKYLTREWRLGWELK